MGRHSLPQVAALTDPFLSAERMVVRLGPDGRRIIHQLPPQSARKARRAEEVTHGVASVVDAPAPSPLLKLQRVPERPVQKRFAAMPQRKELTPMVVLLSLEGFKAPVNGVARRHTNQDRGFIHEVSQRFTVFAIFDGHGEHGHQVAQYVSNAFQTLLQKDFPASEAERLSTTLSPAQVLAWLRTSFATVDRMLTEESGIDCNYSGCTASLAIRYNARIYVAYVGDSKVAGFQFHGKRPYCLVETPEHCPAAKNEMARIRGLGASVSEQHFQHFSKTISRIVEAGLSVSRAFGDLAARPYGLISEPDFVQIDIPSPKRSTHFPLMLIVASDGLWDTISPYEVLDFVSNAQQPQNKLFDSLKQIAEVAWRRRLAAEGRSDDTTAIVALLQ